MIFMSFLYIFAVALKCLQQPKTEREHFSTLCVLAAPDQEILLNNSSGKTTVGSPELQLPPSMQTVLPHPAESGCLKWFQNAPEGAASFIN